MRRRTLLAGAAGAAVVAVTPTRASAAPRVVRTLASGLDIPWGLDFLPDGSALVTERDKARVLRVAPDGTRSVVGSVAGVVPQGEGGLLGLAVSPGFATDRRIYLYLTSKSDNRVGWATYDGTSLSALTYIVTGIPKGVIHNGGGLEFNGAGKLYIGCGDSGDRSLPQNPRSLGGKVLRVSPDGVGNGTRAGWDERVFSIGHRNPQGLAYYHRKGLAEMWGAELGQDTWDEVNLLQVGRNYGWPTVEGIGGESGFVDPFVQWRTANASPSGITTLGRKAYVGALRGESLWEVTIHGVGRGTKVRHFQGAYGRIRNVKAAPDGTLWMTTSNGDDRDKVLKVAVG